MRMYLALIVSTLVLLTIPFLENSGDRLQENQVIYPRPFKFYPDLYTAPFFEAYVLKDFYAENTGEATFGLATADFNKDGWLDIAVGWTNLSNNYSYITVFYGRVDGGFDLKNIREYGYDVIGRTRYEIEDVEAADFNNDGYPDIMAIGDGYVIRNGTKQAVFPIFIIWNNKGKFDEKDSLITQFTLRGYWNNPHITVADFDLDGDVDFVVGSNNGKIKLFKNNGNGTFRDMGIVAFDYGTASWGLDTGDFNDDGYPDLVVCADTEGDPNFTDPGHIYIKLNDRSERCFNSSSPGILVASLPPPIELTHTLGGTPFGSIAVLDYNRDGLLDIVFAGDWSMIMYIQQENFTFKPFLACMFRDMKLTWADHLHEGGFAVGDFNQDGFEDLVVGGVMGTVRLLINNKTYVCISKPEDRSRYFFGKRVYPGFPFPSLKMVIGWVNVEVTFIKNLSIGRVDFYLDRNLVYSDSVEPFEWKWKRFGFGKYLLAVEALDEEGNFLGRDTAIVWKFL